MDAAGEGLLQDLQQGLDGVPLGSAHVHDHREAALAHLLAAEQEHTLKAGSVPGAPRGPGRGASSPALCQEAKPTPAQLGTAAFRDRDTAKHAEPHS